MSNSLEELSLAFINNGENDGFGRGVTNMYVSVKINVENDGFGRGVILLCKTVRSERDRIQPQSIIPQIDLQGIQAMHCENQFTGNDIYE
jgi:hypothetical protein